MADTGRLGHVHVVRRSSRGSKLGTALVLLVAIGGGVAAVHFWRDRPALIRHVSEREALALPAAYVLSLQGAPPEAVVPLQDALVQGDPRLRAACARALGTRRERDVVPFLGEAATQDPEEAVRRAALRALARNGEGNAYRYVEIAFDDPSLAVQGEACRATGDLGFDRLIPRLIEKLNHHDGDLQRAAKAALDRFTPEGISFGFDPRAWREWYAKQ